MSRLHTHAHAQIRRLSLSCCTPWQQNLQHLCFEDVICRTNWSYKTAHDFCHLKALHVFAGSQCHSDVGDMTFLEFFMNSKDSMKNLGSWFICSVYVPYSRANTECPIQYSAQLLLQSDNQIVKAANIPTHFLKLRVTAQTFWAVIPWPRELLSKGLCASAFSYNCCQDPACIMHTWRRTWLIQGQANRGMSHRGMDCTASQNVLALGIHHPIHYKVPEPVESKVLVLHTLRGCAVINHGRNSEENKRVIDRVLVP